MGRYTNSKLGDEYIGIVFFILVVAIGMLIALFFFGT